MVLSSLFFAFKIARGVQTLLLLFSVPHLTPRLSPLLLCQGLTSMGHQGAGRFLNSMGGIFPQELLLLFLRMHEDDAHEDVLLLGNTQEEAQAVSGKTCLGSWATQEELEDEMKLSVGKQPSPVAVLVPAGIPRSPSKVWPGKDTALERAQTLQRPWESN